MAVCAFVANFAVLIVVVLLLLFVTAAVDAVPAAIVPAFVTAYICCYLLLLLIITATVAAAVAKTHLKLSISSHQSHAEFKPVLDALLQPAKGLKYVGVLTFDSLSSYDRARVILAPAMGAIQSTLASLDCEEVVSGVNGQLDMDAIQIGQDPIKDPSSQSESETIHAVVVAAAAAR